MNTTKNIQNTKNGEEKAKNVYLYPRVEPGDEVFFVSETTKSISRGVIKTVTYFDNEEYKFLLEGWQNMFSEEELFDSFDEALDVLNGLDKNSLQENSNIKFQVFDTGEPAEIRSSKIFNNSVFDTFEEAQEYVTQWLGWPVSAKNMLKLNVPIDYSGEKDTIEIKEVII